MTDLRLNARAVAIADRIEAEAAELRVRVHRLPSGARVVDAGIDAPGGLAAGRAMVDVCMSGLGNLSFVPLTIGGEPYQGVQIWTDHPWLACMASQYAGWALHVGDFFAMGSGPLRAVARVEHELFDKLAYSEESDSGVLALEGRTLPSDDVANFVAGKAGIAPSALTLVIAPTASVAGGVQITARIVETGLHKMDALGFDVRRVVSAYGTAPIPPVAKNDLRAIGRTNDCMLYGGQARYVVDADDATLEELAATLPASASSDYGTPFYEIFQRYDRDFYKIDKLLFSPGEVWLTSATSGRTFHGGRLNADVLRTSFRA
jgi:methenyltetrahydromethanopterin cyclohydrolase